MNNKLSELSNPVGYFTKQRDGNYWPLSKSTAKMNMEPLYSQEYVSALLARIDELEWRELNSTELKELLTWHPTENSAATDPILWAAMRNKINFTRVRVASDEAKKEQSNG